MLKWGYIRHVSANNPDANHVTINKKFYLQGEDGRPTELNPKNDKEKIALLFEQSEAIEVETVSEETGAANCRSLNDQQVVELYKDCSYQNPLELRNIYSNQDLLLTNL